MTKKETKCPICRKKVAKDDPLWPFCCKRCKVVDLGNWATGEYRIATEEVVDIDEGSEYERGDSS